VTRTPLSRSKVKGHQAALLVAVLARQAAAAVGMGMCWSWETAATLPSARQREALWCARGRRGAGAYRGGRPPTACSSLRTDNNIYDWWCHKHNYCHRLTSLSLKMQCFVKCLMIWFDFVFYSAVFTIIVCMSMSASACVRVLCIMHYQFFSEIKLMYYITSCKREAATICPASCDLDL